MHCWRQWFKPIERSCINNILLVVGPGDLLFITIALTVYIFIYKTHNDSEGSETLVNALIIDLKVRGNFLGESSRNCRIRWTKIF